MTRQVRGWTEAWCCTAVLLSVGPAAACAQRGQRVSYDVEFSIPGSVMSAGIQCQAGAGFDKLSGTISGSEPAPAHEDNTYEGMLTRTTQVTFCAVASSPNAPDQARNCSVTITGRAKVWFSLEVYADDRGSYLKAMLDRPVKVDTSAVTGTCDPSEMKEWQRDYGKMQTAGSPDGQPINLLALPRTGFPKAFPPSSSQPSSTAGPSAGDAGAWTLTVTARRP